MNDAVFYLVFLGVLTTLAWPLGRWIHLVLNTGDGPGLAPSPNPVLRFFRPLENLFYKLCGIRPDQEMNWKQWASALLFFSLVKTAVVFLILLFQNLLPLNPQNFPGMPWDLALNTAVSFITNTNWQNYAGEGSATYFAQMAALTVQNFLSAASGIAVLTALIRGIVRRQSPTLGNFWVDLVRSVLYILLPLSLVYAVFLVSQGCIQNFLPYVQAGNQTLPMGPLASQEAIKLLGTNGGGFFNANSAHPFENPTSLTNFVETLSVFLIPASLVFAFGRFAQDKRQGIALYAVMTVLFTLFFAADLLAEKAPPAQHAAGVDWSAGNLEGKETRFGVVPSVLFNTVTTATSCGAVNSMLDSYSPLGGMVPLVLIQLGEVVFGGVGSGLYGMLALILLTVFVGGLMVGRTPEYLGKKIEPFDMKMVVIAVMVTPFAVLIGTAAAVLCPQTPASLGNGGPHGFTEVFYAYSSMANNNGSAFAGLNGNTLFFNLTGVVVMLTGRFAVMAALLALAGNLAAKRPAVLTQGTLPTHGLTFSILLIFFIFLVAALNFLPGLALGPLAEFFSAH